MPGVGILHYQQVLRLECFDSSEVTTRKGNEYIVREENCVVEEIKEVELRSHRGKFIYNKTYNPVGLNIRLIIFLDAVVHLADYQ